MTIDEPSLEDLIRRHFVLEKGRDNWDGKSSRSMLECANVAVSVITACNGALRVIPAKEEIAKLL